MEDKMRASVQKNISKSDRSLAKRLGLKKPIILYLDGDVTKKIMVSIWQKINLIRLKNPRQLFCLVVKTTGGDWGAARNFYSLVKLHHINLVTVAVGEVISAGITVLLAGRQRFAQADTEFMDHDITMKTDEKTMQAIRNDLMNLTLKNRVARQIITKNTQLTKAQVRKLYDNATEIYFNAYEAKQMGFIHTILE